MTTLEYILHEKTWEMCPKLSMKSDFNSMVTLSKHVEILPLTQHIYNKYTNMRKRRLSYNTFEANGNVHNHRHALLETTEHRCAYRKIHLLGNKCGPSSALA